MIWKRAAWVFNMINNVPCLSKKGKEVLSRGGGTLIPILANTRMLIRWWSTNWRIYGTLSLIAWFLLSHWQSNVCHNSASLICSFQGCDDPAYSCVTMSFQDLMFRPCLVPGTSCSHQTNLLGERSSHCISRVFFLHHVYSISHKW